MTAGTPTARQLSGTSVNTTALAPISTLLPMRILPSTLAPAPDPVEAIKFRMEQQGLKPKDLEPMIGRRNRVYEVLNGKRKLTMAMVWKLHTGLGIPAESLIRQST